MNKYKDIINLPHHISSKHPPMPLEERAAQFSPYAALTGYHALVEETARLTDTKPELTEEDLEVLDRKLHILQSAAQNGEKPAASITYFVPDERKEGGAFRTVSGIIKSVDFITRTLVLFADNEISAGEIVPTADIIEIGGMLADEIDDWQA